MSTLQQLKDASQDPRLQDFIGKTVIVGIYQFYEDDPITRSQDFGEIIDFTDGMMVLLSQEKRKAFPIKFEAIIPAPRGRYKLDSSGEEITNPDFLVSWRLDLADELEESQWEANTAPHFYSIVGKEWDFEYSYDRMYLKDLIESRGAGLIGKFILIGMREYETQEDGVQKLAKQSQIYGEVARLNFSEGVVVKLRDGSELKLPPDISMLQSPPPREYTLQSTGEVIVNPDLMSEWTLNR